MSESIPVILCGQSTAIASVVIENLKPECEVLHLVLSVPDGKKEIPALLRGETPPEQKDNPADALGTHKYSKAAQAIVLGAGYDAASVKEMRNECIVSDARGVPWLCPDTSKPTPPLGPEYGKALVERVKSCLKKLALNEKMGSDEVVLY